MDLLTESQKEEPILKQIVRLKTSIWSDSKGAYIKRSIAFLKRKSVGFNFFEEECSMIGADEAVRMITNLNSCEDGIYDLDICDEQKDWETGYIDSYKFKLTPYKE